MMRGFPRYAVQPIVRSWAGEVLQNLNSGPFPTDDPRVHASGDNSDRVLLFGTGAAVGWGVLSHELALPGTLARALSALTGRGTDVDVLSGPNFTAAGAIQELAGTDLARYDAVVITLGLNEAVLFGSIRAWRRDLARLLDHLSATMSRSTTVYLLGVHSMTMITPYDQLIDRFARHHRKAINRVTAELCAARADVTYLEYDRERRSEQNRSRTARDYTELGRMLAARIAPALDRGVASAEPAAYDPSAPEDELARQRAVDSLGILDTPREERFDRIVELAKRAFHTSSAAITIIDNDRQWFKSRTGSGAGEIARSASVCATTILEPGALVVADIGADHRFDEIAGVDGHAPVGFYAGFPIEAPNGERIGALCVFDAKARDIRDVDRSLLRDLALMAQREVWIGASI